MVLLDKQTPSITIEGVLNYLLSKCFLLSSAGCCESDEDFIFYGQPISRGNGVSRIQQSGKKKGHFLISASDSYRYSLFISN